MNMTSCVHTIVTKTDRKLYTTHIYVCMYVHTQTDSGASIHTDKQTHTQRCTQTQTRTWHRHPHMHAYTHT